MPKFKGIFSIEGTMHGMTFYKSKDGHLVRAKGGISKERIANDHSFQRTRENGTEFGHCAKMSQLLRKSIADKVELAKDHRTSSRLNKVMAAVKNMDTSSERGERKVWTGPEDPAAAQLLVNFDFNDQSRVSQIFKASYVLDRTAES